MDNLVLPEGGALPESFVTVLTLVWFLSRMNPLMLNKVCPLAKGLRTLTAFIGSLPCVDPPVLSKEGLGAEGSPTFRTSVPFLLCEAARRFHQDWHLGEAVLFAGLYEVHVPKSFLLG